MSDSLITKNAIAKSLKELMRKRDLRKISVADIVQNCGINRQTFYYHFKDKYDLVNWIFYSEVVLSITQEKEYGDWSEAMLDVLKVMKEEQDFYTGALNLTGQNAFQEYFFEVTRTLVREIIDTLAEGRDMEEKDKNFIAEFYTYGLVGTVLAWARAGMKEPPAELVGRLKYFVDDSKRFAAARYLKDIRVEPVPKPPEET